MQSVVLAQTPIQDHAAIALATARPEASESPQMRLIQTLIARRQLREDDLPRVRRLLQDSDTPLCSLLLRLGVVGERQLAEALSESLGLALLSTADYPQSPVLPDRLAPRFLKSRRIIPIAKTDVGIMLVMSDPLDDFAVTAVALASARPVTVAVGVTSEIDAALERLYGDGKSAMGRIIASIDQADDGNEEDIEHLKDLASEAPIIRLVNLILQEAVALGASDIHIEPFERHLKVRYRVDGFLRETEAPPTQSIAAVISRIKLLAKLNIAERRLPQDGRIQLRVQGREIDVRVSTAPTLHGESIVLRLLETGNAASDFISLGFTPDVLDALHACLKQPQGILLVTGPTGSGKTTTLYTALTELNTAERKIITVEDPIEYQLDGVNQIQVKPQVGLSFVNALRSILRQDPDVIMIGEMRDSETAHIAVQSALTGHLVLSTLHTNDAPGAITRLLDMGVEDYLLTSTVSAILAQRLVRRLCQHCRTAYCPTAAIAALLQREHGNTPAPEMLYAPAGCEHCGGTGYDGRIAIHELLTVTEPLRRLILNHADAGELTQAAIGAGMRTMREDGFAKVAAGVTSIDEVLRVTQEMH